MTNTNSDLIEQWTEDMTTDRTKRGFSGPPKDMSERVKHLLEFAEFANMDLEEIINPGNARPRDPEFTNTSLERIITVGNTKPRELEKLIVNYYSELLKTKKASSARREVATSVYAFLREMYVLIKFQIPKDNTKTEAEKIDELDFITDEKGITPLAKEFLDVLPKEYRVVAMVLLSTGGDIGNVLDLKVGDIRGQLDKDRFFWSAERPKSGYPIRVFFTRETTAIVKQFVLSKRSSAQDDEPLFVGVNGEALNVGNVNDAFKRAAVRINAMNGEPLNPFRPRAFRKAIAKACIFAEIDEDLMLIFMGKKATGKSKIQYTSSRSVFLNEYKKVEKFLTVNEQMTQDAQETFQYMKQLEATIDTTNKRIERQSNDIEIMKKTTESLTKSVQTAMSIIWDMSQDLGIEFEEVFKKHFKKE